MSRGYYDISDDRPTPRAAVWDRDSAHRRDPDFEDRAQHDRYQRSTSNEHRFRRQPRRRRSSDPGAELIRSRYSSLTRRADADRAGPHPRGSESREGRRREPKNGSGGGKDERGALYNGDVRGLIKHNFDISANGAGAAVVGAGLGAFASRRFAPSGNDHFDPGTGRQRWKTGAGAAMGAVAANFAENMFQEYRQHEGRGHFEKVKEKLRDRMEQTHGGC